MRHKHRGHAVSGDDIGKMVARVPTGALLMGHGAQKLFGWFGGPGLDDAGKQMSSLGYPRGKAMAALAGLTEVAAGAGLVAGVVTPLAAAGVVGVMANAGFAAHRQAGLWNQNGGYEYPLVLTTLAIGLAANGPGKLSVDAMTSRRTHGLRWAATAVGTGLAAAAAILSTRKRGEDQD